MSTLFAFCPQCHHDVAFESRGGFNECPRCGFRYQLSEGRAGRASPGQAAVMTVFKALLIVFAIMGVIAVVGLGILFAACARGFH